MDKTTPKKPKKPTKVSAEKTFEELNAKATLPQYKYQKYESDKDITIPGTLFADFINLQSRGTQLLEQVKSNLISAIKAIDIELASRDIMTMRLMEQHMKNVDAGLTTTVNMREEVETEAKEIEDAESGK